MIFVCQMEGVSSSITRFGSIGQSECLNNHVPSQHGEPPESKTRGGGGGGHSSNDAAGSPLLQTILFLAVD